MMLGLSLATFTALHVAISVAAIGAGVAMIPGLMDGRRPGGLVLLFLVATALTSITGFMFPFSALLPSHVVGLISLVALAAAVVALYVFHLSGPWRWVYVVGAVAGLYFNVFVLLAQGFQKVGALHALAPTQSEPPFVVAQLILLVLFLAGGWLAVRRFHPAVA